MVQKASSLEKSATSTAADENKAQMKDLGAADATYSQFTGSNMTNSPFYKALVTSGTDATTTAYNNAKSNIMARASAAGFGQASPAAQGGNAQVAQQEAATVGKIPVQAEQTAADYAIQGAQGLQGSAGQMGQQSLGYEDAATSLQNTRRSNNSAMARTLVSSAAGASGWK